MKPTFVLGLCLGVSLTLAAQANPPGSARIVEGYGKLPLAFEANQGQSDPQVKFLSRGAGYSLSLTSNEAVLVLHEASRREPALPGAKARTAPEKTSREIKSAVLRMKLVGANAKAEVTGQDELPGKSNYFIGNDPKKWHTNVRQFAKVRYRDVYPGIDLVYYGHQRELEYDFVLQPEADPEAIRIWIEGASKLRLEHGELVLGSVAGDVHLRRLQIYQEVNGRRQSVAGRFVMKSRNEVGFEIGSYDRRRALIIDPVLVYSTYLGGSGADDVLGIAVDAAGNAYVTGGTDSTDFPRVNPIQPTNHGSGDAFVTKINAEGTGLVYSTYLGGSRSDGGISIALDSAGNAYVTGPTASTDFPTVNPFQPTIHGETDAYVTKINAEGTALVYSSYLGGSVSYYPDTNPASSFGAHIAVDSNDSAFVTGSTNTTDFPIAHAVQPTYGGGYSDGFATKVDASGNTLIYSTYLGGSDIDQSSGIAVDSAGNAYVTGLTYSTDFPTKNAFQPTNHGSVIDAFVTKINATGSALVYSTYLGGSGVDGGSGIAVDATGHAYVTGSTTSTDFPTKNALTNSCCVFATKFNAQGGALVYSTYLGEYQGRDIAVDSSGNAYVTGTTDGSAAFVFAKEISATGSALVYSIYLGDHREYWGSIAVDPAGSAYVAGSTYSKHFPTTLLAFQQTFAGQFDAFVSKIAPETFVSTSPTRVGFQEQVIGTTSAPRKVVLTNQGSGTLTINKIYLAGRNAGDFTQTNDCGVTLLGGASCTVSITFRPLAINVRKGVLGISDSDLASPQAIALSGQGTVVSLSPTALAFERQPVGTTSPPKVVTLTNVASTSLNFTDISVGGVDPGDFQQTNTCGTSIPGGASCTITVTFTPTATGKRKATVTISDNGGGSPQRVALTGTGT